MPRSPSLYSIRDASSSPLAPGFAALSFRCDRPAASTATDSSASPFARSFFPKEPCRPSTPALQGVESDAVGNVQLDTEGGTKSTPSKTRFLSTGASVGHALIGSGGRRDVGTAGPVTGGATGYKLIGIIVGAVYQNHNYAILMSAYGGGSSIYWNFLARGREIVFPKNTAMNIGFGNRTTLPMPAADHGPVR